MLTIKDFNGMETKILEANQPHVPVVLLADTSGSMASSIHDLNQALTAFKRNIETDMLASAVIDIALVEFNSTTTVRNQFQAVKEWNPPTLSVSGSTEMGAATQVGLNMLKGRMRTYMETGVPFNRGWIILVTDGAPTDSIDEVSREIKGLHGKKKIHSFALAAPGFNASVLNNLCPSGVFQMTDSNYMDALKMFSSTLITVSGSKPDTLIPMEKSDNIIVISS